MLLQSLSVLPVLAGLSGVSVHHLLYRHGEWDLKGVKLIIGYITLTLVLIAIQYSSSLPPIEILHRPNWALCIVIYHILGVYTSILLYRAAFHRLNRFPGPFLARLSNFYVTSLAAKKLHLFEETEKLHKKHGDYVRIGPSQLSIRDPAAVKLIHGSQTKTSKGVWYTCSEPFVSLETQRDKKLHAIQRKYWDQAFSTPVLKNYEPRLSYYTSQLLTAIDSHLGQSMNVTQWFNYYAFDVMGELAFGQGFNMLAEGKDQYFMAQLRESMTAIGLTSHLSWLLPFFKRVPGVNAGYINKIKWLSEQVENRIRNPPDRPDIFLWVLQGYEKSSKTKQDFGNLANDAELICVAGSDTTSATLINMFFRLTKNQALYKNLQGKLDALEDLSQESLKGVKLLDAVINETLRLHPAVPSGVQRLTPPEGLQINSTYIPGEVLVSIPMHALYRDERVFPQPTEFIPERWTTQPELIKNASAYFPFGGGSYICAGKQLALMELRQVAAEILTRYNVKFAPDHSDEAFLDGAVDAFTIVPAPLKLVFERR